MMHQINGLYFVYLFKVIILVQTSIIIGTQELLPPATQFSRHTIVQPILQHDKTKSHLKSTRETSGLHHPEVTMKVALDGEEYTVDLRLNQDLVNSDHVITYQEGGKTVTHKPKKEELDLCHYGGTVRDKAGSWVAVSTCHGVQGIVFDGDRMRYIEPAEGEGDITSSHYVYEHGDLSGARRCGYVGGVTNNSRYDPQLYHKYHSENQLHKSRISRYKRHSSYDTQVHEPYNANKRSRYVELVLVADSRVFRANGDSLRMVHLRMKTLTNIINSVYSPLNIFISLVGVIVWNQYDKIQLSNDPDTTLTNFLKYRETVLVKDIPNDNAHLVTGQEFSLGVIGKAPVASMCATKFSGGVSNYHSEVMGHLAMTMAHEMGHNFGMAHDEDQCKCPDQKCIMSPSSSSDYTPSHWSSCSLKWLTLSFSKGMDHCLRNKPRRLFDSPTCGNGFVEAGEQCDCGTTSSARAHNPCHACCDPRSCMLRANASCGAGACCDLQTCRPTAAGTECRAAGRECDLPEYCSGHSEFCPADVYKMDTTPCGTEAQAAYCIRGDCRSHTDQCRMLWGTTGSNSHDQCYKRNNIKGTFYGNCGYDRRLRQYLQCAPQDARCGRLQCAHLDKRLDIDTVHARSGYQQFNTGDETVQCHVAEIDMGLDNVDTGLVPDGAKCGDEMMCLKQRCVSVTAVRETIARADYSVCPSNCSGHGICNSEGRCHCEPGFAPPLCATPGPGGSTDSGPAGDQTSLRKFMIAMYAIFLGIVPAVLLILFLIYYYCPDVVLRCKTSLRELQKNNEKSLNLDSKKNPEPDTPIYANIEYTGENTPVKKSPDNLCKGTLQKNIAIISLPIKSTTTNNMSQITLKDIRVPKASVDSDKNVYIDKKHNTLGRVDNPHYKHLPEIPENITIGQVLKKTDKTTTSKANWKINTNANIDCTRKYQMAPDNMELPNENIDKVPKTIRLNDTNNKKANINDNKPTEEEPRAKIYTNIPVQKLPKTTEKNNENVVENTIFNLPIENLSDIPKGLVNIAKSKIATNSDKNACVSNPNVPKPEENVNLSNIKLRKTQGNLYR